MTIRYMLNEQNIGVHYFMHLPVPINYITEFMHKSLVRTITMGNRRKQIYGTCTLCIKYYKVTNLEASVPKRSASTTHKAETLHALLLPNKL
jgi:hypothetical protein